MFERSKKKDGCGAPSLEAVSLDLSCWRFWFVMKSRGSGGGGGLQVGPFISVVFREVGFQQEDVRTAELPDPTSRWQRRFWGGFISWLGVLLTLERRVYFLWLCFSCCIYKMYLKIIKMKSFWMWGRVQARSMKERSPVCFHVGGSPRGPGPELVGVLGEELSVLGSVEDIPLWVIGRFQGGGPCGLSFDLCLSVDFENWWNQPLNKCQRCSPFTPCPLCSFPHYRADRKNSFSGNSWWKRVRFWLAADSWTSAGSTKLVSPVSCKNLMLFKNWRWGETSVIQDQTRIPAVPECDGFVCRSCWMESCHEANITTMILIL